jgi:hypothetical protein
VKNWLVSLALSLSLFIPNVVRAWGSQGHAIVALEAQSILSSDNSAEAKNALASVKAILGDTTIDQAAVWPDQVKEQSRACSEEPYVKDPSYSNPRSSAICDAYKGTAKWHFYDTDTSAYAYNPDAQNYNDGDLYVILRTLAHSLAGTTETVVTVPESFTKWQAQCQAKSDQPCKKEALEFLIHFVGDIHQPLHSGATCDVGGNDQYITWFGQAQMDPIPSYCHNRPASCANFELHEAWDTEILLHKGDSTPIPYTSNDDYAGKLMNLMKGRTASSDPTQCVTAVPSAPLNLDAASFPSDWINESLCYMPQIYTFPDDSLAAKKSTNKNVVAQKKAEKNSKRNVAQAATVNRCQSDRAMPSDFGGKSSNYKAVAVGQQYYDTNIVTVNERLYWAGNRLATLLKTIYGQGDKATTVSAEKARLVNKATH